MAIQKRTYIDFLGQPEPSVWLTAAVGGTHVADGTDNSVNQWQFSNGAQLEVINADANADIIPTKVAGEGLRIPLDSANEDGIEITVSDSLNSTGPCFTVGTDAAFRVDMKVKIVDVSELDVAAVGFRKQAAYTAAIEADGELITDYTDIACLNVNLGNIDTNTRINSSGPSAVDTTDDWADAAVHKVKVLVSSAGVVTYKLDNTTPGAAAAFTFDDGEVVTPFFFYLNDSDVAGAVVLQKLKHGRQ